MLIKAQVRYPEYYRVQDAIGECKRELGSTVDELTNVKLGIITPGTGRQVLCVHRRLGYMDLNGDIIPGPYELHIAAVTDDKGRQAEFRRCGAPQGLLPAEVKAINFDRCFQAILQIMGRDG
ncbi:uncharacterized protein LOC114325764 [Diabrotica virgifera virgifera]|uniref:Uncharacterized protein n=1 Tax=Diabrotica virgifera virgifera TaxID=50390 RepID=A0ABM5JYF2_DIAVI|nr:uncharacterized protein LOC114325764 [Diabrotica virgifera virgifera]